MPKYVRKKATPLAWLIVFSLLALLAFFATTYFLIIVGLFALVMVLEFFGKPRENEYYENLYNSRRVLSICDFAKEFDCKVVDTWIIRAVYEEIQEYLPLDEKMPIKSSDNLKTDLRLDDDDLDLDLAEQISQRTGRTMENCENNPYYGKVFTVKDLVLFFNYQALNNAT